MTISRIFSCNRLPVDNCRQACSQLSTSLLTVVDRLADICRQATTRLENPDNPASNLKYMRTSLEVSLLLWIEKLHKKKDFLFRVFSGWRVIITKGRSNTLNLIKDE